MSRPTCGAPILKLKNTLCEKNITCSISFETSIIDIIHCVLSMYDVFLVLFFQVSPPRRQHFALLRKQVKVGSRLLTCVHFNVHEGVKPKLKGRKLSRQAC